MSDAVRFIVTGDLHYRGTNPRARTDDFQAALDAKMAEVDLLARTHSCAGIIIPGDITDSPGITLPTIGDLCIRLLQAEKSLYVIPGNHDMWGANTTALSRTPYRLLARITSNIYDLSRYEQMIPLESKYIRLTGSPYSAMTDRNLGDYLVPNLDAQKEWTHGAFHIHVAHGMLLDKPPGYDLGRYTLIDDVANHPDAPDVLICGHEHIGFGVIKRGRTTFINPGALCRLTAHPAEIERQVQVCLLTIEYGGDDVSTQGFKVSTQLIPLQSARPGHEVLSREHLEEQASREELISSFMALLVEEGEGRFLETQDIVEDIARREHIPQNVVDEALKRIGRAREVLGL
jgi:exonuclease SbcD